MLWRGPSRVPSGLLELAASSAAATSSRPMPLAARAVGSTCTRTAYFCAPNTRTWAIPGRLEMRWPIIVSAYSSTAESGRVAELSARNRTGWSAGLTLRKLGGVVISAGRRRAAAAIAD